MLALESVSVRIDGRTILEDVSIRIARGTVAAVIGPNGAGKTTLFRAVAGILPTESGGVRLDGQRFDSSSPAWHGLVSFVPDGNDLFPELTAGEHFTLAADLFMIGKREAAVRGNTLIGLFSLEEYRDHPAGSLSTGLSKRLAVALSVFRKASVFLFDEPFNGLDAESVSLFLGLLRFLKERDSVVLVSSHYLPVLPEFSDEILELRDGRVAGRHVPPYSADDGPLSIPANTRTVKLPWL